MPIYEYQCTECEYKMEALRKISDEPLLDCPACGKPALKKLVSAASFRLKGSGWYETDFKTGNKKQLAKSESASPSSSEKKASPDAKPSKTEAKTEGSKNAAKSSSSETKKPASKAS